jgi:mono/diheme cytochrome c family protein
MGKAPIFPIFLLLCAGAAVFPQETGKPAATPPAPAASAAKGDAARGKQIFENTCDECHDAYSREERVGPGLQGLKSGKLPDGRPATHDKLLEIVNNGPAEMPSFRDRLTEQQKEDVVTFVMTL